MQQHGSCCESREAEEVGKRHVPSTLVELPPRPPMLRPQQLAFSSDRQTVDWFVDARKLQGKGDRGRVVSPQFELDLGEVTGVPFKLMIFTKVVRALVGPKQRAMIFCPHSFKENGGYGSIQVKCLESVHIKKPRVWLHVSIDGVDSPSEQATSGPKRVDPFKLHDFSDDWACTLPDADEEWDLGALTLQKSKLFVVRLSVFPFFGPLEPGSDRRKGA